jgi:hypothetical protein
MFQKIRQTSDYIAVFFCEYISWFIHCWCVFLSLRNMYTHTIHSLISSCKVPISCFRLCRYVGLELSLVQYSYIFESWFLWLWTQTKKFNKNVINIVSFVCQRCPLCPMCQERRNKEHKFIFILNLVTAKEINNFLQYGPVVNICAQLHYKCIHAFPYICNICSVECKVFLFHEHVCWHVTCLQTVTTASSVAECWLR